MALDGLFLHCLAGEIAAGCLGARVEKIAQPAREELVLTLRGREGSRKLLLSGGAQAPRAHLIEKAPENPKTPPMFCMLLRKRLGGGKLTAVRQMGLDRILRLEFDAFNDLGDPVRLTLVLEIMGRHSNLILLEEDGKIVDSIRRVDVSTSRVRQVLPGMAYVSPPAQDKRSILEIPPEEIAAELRAGGGETELSKALMERLEGFSAISAREAAFYTTRGVDTLAGALTEEQGARLTFFLAGVAQRLRQNAPAPTMVLEPGGRPRDFCCLPVHQYGAAMVTREHGSCSALLESFYADRDRLERVRQRSGDLLTFLAGATERIARKLSYQREELVECRGREQLREKGDLVGANLWQITQGDSAVTVENFYDPQGGNVEIPLDPRLSPAQNAQRYYALYRKADTAEKHLTKLIAQGEQELVYLDSVFDALTRADGEAELEAIRRELADSGYLRRMRRPQEKGKPQREQKLPPLRYRSGDGFTILCGRNNLQNDRLTLKEAKPTDLWLHTQKIPGSHVIVLTEGRPVPDATLLQAAAIAAYNSKGRASSKVPVDYAPVKQVKKPAGAKPGMVIYERHQTVLVEPDEALVNALAQ